jgi:hypothetical protein
MTDNIRRAATILLMREDHGVLEVYMVQRPHGVDFPNLHVFPGGKVDEVDAHAFGAGAQYCDGLSDADASARRDIVAQGRQQPDTEEHDQQGRGDLASQSMPKGASQRRR